MKIRFLVPVIAVGLALGFGGASLLSPQPSRPERIVELLERICLPHVQSEDARSVANALLTPVELPYPATQVPSPYQDEMWYDQQSRALVALNGRRCMIELHGQDNLSEEDAEILGHNLDDWQAEYFPDLQIDPIAHNWIEPLSRGWFLGERGSPERWGLNFLPFLNGREDDVSFLHLTAPLPPLQ